MLSVKFQGKTYSVASIQDAARKWDEFRFAAACAGAGSSQVGNGVSVRDARGKIVARVSYNGRIWNPNGTPMLEAVPMLEAA